MRRWAKSTHELPYVPKIITESGRQALAIIIPGSESRPHFAGLSYIRNGSESIEASEEQFSRLIAQRNSKVTRILEWIGKPITLGSTATERRRTPANKKWHLNLQDFLVVSCDQFYLTVLIPYPYPIAHFAFPSCFPFRSRGPSNTRSNKRKAKPQTEAHRKRGL